MFQLKKDASLNNDDVMKGNFFSKWKDVKSKQEIKTDEDVKLESKKNDFEKKVTETKITEAKEEKKQVKKEAKEIKKEEKTKEDEDNKLPSIRNKRKNSSSVEEEKNPKKPATEEVKKEDKEKASNGVLNKKTILKGIVFAISGIQNPERSNIRDKALQMGAKYKPDWDKDCTHLM